MAYTPERDRRGVGPAEMWGEGLGGRGEGLVGRGERRPPVCHGRVH